MVGTLLPQEVSSTGEYVRTIGPHLLKNANPALPLRKQMRIPTSHHQDLSPSTDLSKYLCLGSFKLATCLFTF